MYGVRFIVAILVIAALVILVWGLLGLRRVALLRIRLLVMRRVLTLVLVSGRRVLRVLLLGRLLWLVWRLNRGSARLRQHCVAGVAVLAVDRIAGMARGAVGDKGVAAVCAYPLSPQVLCAAFRAGNCLLVHENICKRR